MTRDMIAKTIVVSRELPKSAPKPPGSRSALPALRVARTHAAKLIEYLSRPPTRKSSVSLRCAKLAAAIRESDIAPLTLAVEDIDPNALLDELESGRIDVDTLRGLIRVADAAESASGGMGRPWAAHTTIIRAGCIAWERAGQKISYGWHDDRDALTGALPDFLRDLLACCNGTHSLTKTPPRRLPIGYSATTPTPRGDVLRRRVPDQVIRDGIRAWQRWSNAHPAKSGTFFS
jgi:hypothetical protein